MSEMRLLLVEIQALKRRIQALETVSEHPGFAASDVARLSQNNTFAGIQTIPNTGLHLLDTDGSHDLIIAPGSDLSADRTLTLTTGDAARTITLSGNPTLADWFDQSVKTSATPTFAQVTVDNLVLNSNTLSSTSGAVTITPLAGQNFNVSLSSTGDFAVNTDDFYVDTSAGNVGFGTTTPGYRLHILETSAVTTRGLTVEQADSGASAAQLNLVKNSTSPADNDFLGTHRFVFYNEAAPQEEVLGAYISTQIKDVSDGTEDVDMYFGQMVAGTSTEVMRFSAGNVGFGTNMPTAKNHIDQSSTTGAIPVLTLDQADLSEEFINFVGTVGTGNSIEAVGAKTLTTTHFLRMQIEGVGYVYVPAGTIA